MTRPQSPHNNLFIEAFGTVEAARGMAQSLLPEAILDQLDLNTLAPVPGSFVDEALADSESDLLFSVTLAGRPALLYFLLEHKSYVDRWVAHQLLRYVCGIWDQARSADSSLAQLPPVIAVVVYHGETRWSAPTRLQDLVDPVVQDVPALTQLTPAFEYVLDDLTQATDEQLLARGMGLLPGIAAIFLRDARSPDRVVPMLRRLKALLRELWRAPNGRRAVAILLRYLWLVAQVDADEVATTVKDIHPDAEELIMTIAEQLRQEGEKQGIQQGIQQGRVATLRMQLEEQFGPLDTAVLERLQSADEEHLQRYTKRILSANTLDEVLED